MRVRVFCSFFRYEYESCVLIGMGFLFQFAMSNSQLKMQIIEADPLEKKVTRFPTSPDGRLIKCCHGLARRFSHRVMYFIPISFEYCTSFHSKRLVTLASNQSKHVRGLRMI